jgi:hypothetical protein
MPEAGPDHVARRQMGHQHDVGAGVETGGQPAEAGVEAERQHRRDHVFGGVAQVAADALRAGDEGAVRQDHALGPAGAARGVEDRSDVSVDGHRRRARLRPGTGAQVCPRRHRAPALGRGRTGADDDHVFHGLAPLELVAEEREPFRRGHQDPRAAVAQHVRHLFRSQQRVDRDEHRPGRRGGEHRRDRLGALVQVDRHPLAALHAEPAQGRRHVRHVPPQLRVGAREVPGGQCRPVTQPAGGVRDDVVQLGTHQAGPFPRRRHQNGTQTSSLYR